jgi:hypothetical protein
VQQDAAVYCTPIYHQHGRLQEVCYIRDEMTCIQGQALSQFHHPLIFWWLHRNIHAICLMLSITSYKCMACDRDAYSCGCAGGSLYPFIQAGTYRFRQNRCLGQSHATYCFLHSGEIASPFCQFGMQVNRSISS